MAKTLKPASQGCAICGKPVDPRHKPFCSARCADVDLNRWLKGVYAVPVAEIDDEDGTKPDETPSEEQR